MCLAQSLDTGPCCRIAHVVALDSQFKAREAAAERAASAMDKVHHMTIPVAATAGGHAGGRWTVRPRCRRQVLSSGGQFMLWAPLLTADPIALLPCHHRLLTRQAAANVLPHPPRTLCTSSLADGPTTCRLFVYTLCRHGSQRGESEGRPHLHGANRPERLQNHDQRWRGEAGCCSPAAAAGIPHSLDGNQHARPCSRRLCACRSCC